MSHPPNVRTATSDRVVFADGSLFDVATGLLWSSVAQAPDAPPTPHREVETGYREAVPQLQISTTYSCNMACSYCSFRPRMVEPVRPVSMPKPTAEQAINFFRSHVDELGSAYARIDFGLTGEPMLRRSLHPALARWIDEAFAGSDVKAVWAGPHVTNGTVAFKQDLIDELGPPQDISLDGPREVHDAVRPYVAGGGTYDDVLALVRPVLARHPNIGVSAVLTARFPHPDQVFLHLHEELGFRNIYMKPVNLPPENPDALNVETLPAFVEGYTRLVNLVLAHPAETRLRYLLALNSEDFFMRFFYRVKDRTRLVYRCGAGKSGAYVDTDGSLYPCAHFIGKTGWAIGHVDRGFDQDARARYLALHVDGRQPCRTCWARYVCGGGCYYQAVLTTGDPAQPDPVKCDLVRHLAAEAARLIVGLSAETPEVLDALPRPVLVADEYLDREATAPYRPMATLSRSAGEEWVDLTRPAYLTGRLASSAPSLPVALEQRAGRLRIILSGTGWNQVETLQVWAVDPSVELVTLAEIGVIRPGLLGRLLEVDLARDLATWLVTTEGRRRAVPYDEPRREPAPSVVVRRNPDGRSVEIPLSSVVTRDAQMIWLNLTVHLAGGGSGILVPGEPLGSFDLAGNGRLSLKAVPRELPADTTASALNGSPPGSEPLGRCRAVRPNVC